MNENKSLKEIEALNEMDNLFFQLGVILNGILDIEEKHGFLKDEQYNKLFADTNSYPEMRRDVMRQNEEKPPKIEEPVSLNSFIFRDDEDDGNDEMCIKNRARQRELN